jgi:hypothetical protein
MFLNFIHDFAPNAACALKFFCYLRIESFQISETVSDIFALLKEMSTDFGADFVFFPLSTILFSSQQL